MSYIKYILNIFSESFKKDFDVIIIVPNIQIAETELIEDYQLIKRAEFRFNNS